MRNQVNKHVGRIKRMFRWAAQKKLVGQSVFADLGTVEGLRRGRSKAEESEQVLPVADEIIDATIPHLSPTVAAMLQFQRYTGARAGEVCIMRTCDLDVAGEVWTFKPRIHKTSHLGKERIIYKPVQMWKQNARPGV